MDKQVRKRIESLVWKTTHMDCKSLSEEGERLLTLREGGTHLVPLSSLTDEELLDKVPKYACFPLGRDPINALKAVVGWEAEGVKFYYLHDVSRGKKFGPFLSEEDARNS